MARTQNRTRNLSKKVKKTLVPKPIVNDEPLKTLQRRAEDLGLIIHAQSGKKKNGDKKQGHRHRRHARLSLISSLAVVALIRDL